MSDAATEQMQDSTEAVMINLMEEMGITEEMAMSADWEPDLETMLKMQAEMMNFMEDSMETMGSLMNTVVADAFDEFLSPEQLQTIQESQLANLGELPVFSPSIFEALDLTDAQREQMEQIKQELEPDFEANLDDWVDGFLAVQKRVDEEYTKELRAWNESSQAQEQDNADILADHFLREWEPGQELAPGEVVTAGARNESVADEEPPILYVVDRAAIEEYSRAMAELYSTRPRPEDIRKRLLADDPEFREIWEAMQSKSKTFAAEFKDRMSDVLTVEQRARLQELIANPPEHALAFRKALRERLGLGESEESESVASGAVDAESGVWVPGPNSWRPGDPVPSGFRIERNTRSRFPRGEE